MQNAARYLVPLLVLLIGSLARADAVLLEAEQFKEYGGWMVDQQFMDQMGSPFLLAHGLGVPVADAKTVARLTPGKYRVWARTRDWVATWKAPGAPGKFQVLIDGKALGTTFGTEGAAWHWQDGGTVEIARDVVDVSLHDLTGFEGRCDAILLSSDLDFRPPDGGEDLAKLRRKWLNLPEEPEDGGSYDLVVAGGGMAGTCAAISAARLGLSVALVQDRPVLGGNNSSDVRVWLQGARNLKPYPRVGDVVAEMEQKKTAHYGPTNTAEIYEDEKKLAVARGEPSLKLFLQHRVQGADVKEKRIQSLVATDVISGRRLRLKGRWFADTTGDACLGALVGADFEMEPKGRMGSCNLWNVKDAGEPQAFPRVPWALDLSDKPFPGRDRSGAGKHDPLKLGGWYWEAGFDRNPFDEGEYIRDWNFRAMYGAWDALKNVDKAFPTYKLNWCAHIAGKRESRRLMGDVVITKKDLEQMTDFEDGFAPTGWKIDLHLPDKKYEKGFEGDAFISAATFGPYKMPFWIPYRALYSRNIANLFMAGRDCSVTHEALGAVRVMRTAGTMGEVVGMAASVCKKYDTDPREVYTKYLPALKEQVMKGAGKQPATDEVHGSGARPAARASGAAKAVAAKLERPAWLKAEAKNLAGAAKVTTGATRDGGATPPALLIDGKFDLNDPRGRWISDGNLPAVIEFAWDQEHPLGAVRIVSGFPQGGGIVAPVGGVIIQVQTDGQWKEAAKVQGNDKVDLWIKLDPAAKATAARILVTESHTNTARVWEIEWYPGE